MVIVVIAAPVESLLMPAISFSITVISEDIMESGERQQKHH
jgi:hypothetical protein